MKLWLQNIGASHVRRERRSLERWHEVRAKGKPRFVLESAATWGFTLVGVMNVYDYVTVGSHSASLSELGFYLVAGLVAGAISWFSMERKYQKALNESLKAPPDPQLRITP